MGPLPNGLIKWLINVGDSNHLPNGMILQVFFTQRQGGKQRTIPGKGTERSVKKRAQKMVVQAQTHMSLLQNSRKKKPLEILKILNFHLLITSRGPRQISGSESESHTLGCCPLPATMANETLLRDPVNSPKNVVVMSSWVAATCIPHHTHLIQK